MDINQIRRWMVWIIIRMFNKFPIKHNKVFMFSYYGAQYGCNPKYITDYMMKHYKKDTFDMVWAFNDPKSHANGGGYLRKVKTMSIRYFYELCTAKVVITNFRTTDLFVKRKEQYYIQTWHSSLRLKQIEKDAESVLATSYIEMAKSDSLKCDLLLSGCQFSTEIFEQSFWYDGEILEYGTPRNDMLMRADIQKRREILNTLHISPNTKILLYAPTFRKDQNLNIYNIDYEKLNEQLTNTFGGKWLVLVKLHPHLLSIQDKIMESECVKNVTTYDDIQELLVVADVLISDYSSLIFDYAITGRPCFLYVPDIEEYTAKERKLYFTLAELPFISARSNEALFAEIERYNAEEYKQKVHTFLRRVGSYEDGRASEYLLKRIENVCFNEERDEKSEAV